MGAVATGLALAMPNRALQLFAASGVVMVCVPLAMGLNPSGSFSATHGTAAAFSHLQATPHDLRVVTFNTWDSVDNSEAIARFVDDQAADIVVLAEVVPSKVGLVRRLSQSYPFAVDCADDWECGMVLLSRLRLESGGASHATNTTPALVWGRISGGNGALTILGVHVHRPTRSPATHAAEMKGLTQLVLREQLILGERGAVIVAGDFNAPAWSGAMSQFLAATMLKPMPVVVPSWPSWPVSAPQFPLDHILVSRDLRITDVETGPAAGSDHLPVIARVTLPVQDAPHDPTLNTTPDTTLGPVQGKE